ncbi:MAG: hypothetical protein ACRD0K_14555 [Egibacteraceae bacterium]
MVRPDPAHQDLPPPHPLQGRGCDVPAAHPAAGLLVVTAAVVLAVIYPQLREPLIGFVIDLAQTLITG